MRIVFMGTPEYSVKTLDALYNSDHDVVAVFAQPDKPVGRKQILTPPATKVYATEKNIPVHQPNSLKGEEALELLKSLSPDVIVVVAYGKLLPCEILELPKYGCVNGHASLLPRHRGASPIQWSIVSGDKTTGVTTMMMDIGMDTGDILEKAEVEILEDETADQLFERLSYVSADLMLSTLSKLEENKIIPIKQDENLATYAPIIRKEMAHLDFSKTATELCRMVRGYYSWPCAFCFVNGKRLKVLSAKECAGKNCEPGKVIESDSKLVVSCGDNTAIEFLTVQLEGKAAMQSSQMLCGYKIPVGTEVV